jgi:hypothetical protein
MRDFLAGAERCELVFVLAAVSFLGAELRSVCAYRLIFHRRNQ